MATRVVQSSALPKYRQVIEILMADIRDSKFPPGSQFPTEMDWTQRLKVSRHTVRAAIAQLQLDGYLRREQGRGTFVTTPSTLVSAAAAATRDVAVMVPCITHFATMIRGIEDACKEQNWHLIVGNSDLNREKELHYIREWLARPVAGALLTPPVSDYVEVCRAMRERAVPFVLLDNQAEGVEADFVGAENEAGARAGTEVLIRNGARRIAFISGFRTSYTSRKRLAGFRAALAAAGLTENPALILEGGFTPEFGVAAVRALLALRPVIDGLFIANHPIAEGALPELLRQGVRIPEEVKVCTFDRPDLPFHMRVPLVMVVQPFYDEGHQAAELLIGRIAERRQGLPAAPPTSLSLPTRLEDGLGAPRVPS